MSRRMPLQTDLEKLRALEEQLEQTQKLVKLKAELPHLYKYKHYAWSRKFYDSTNKMNFLCAANQIAKSSTQIRKCIHWCTNREQWPSLWKNKPNLFWYMYPSKEIATTEYMTKWQEFLPTGAMKEDPYYGWRAEFDKDGYIQHIQWNSGVLQQFRFYSQKSQNLQASTLYALFCDEELPEHHYDELKFRLSATQGYFHMVFTATLGQQLWFDTIEEVGGERERFPEALKVQVSLFDCLEYEDGSNTPWTKERIKLVIRDCKNDQEIQRRVFGRFIRSEQQLFHGFNRKEHLIKQRQIPKDWAVYAGIDIGSGGDRGHPAAIIFVAVRPDFQLGYVIAGWRGDRQRTTAGDVLEQYVKMCQSLPPVTAAYYDFAAADFGTLAARSRIPVLTAKKSHEQGLQMMNTLFKNNMLYIFEDNELIKLVAELVSITEDQLKKRRADDFTDALRYAVMGVTWDTSVTVQTNEPRIEARVLTLNELRRQGHFGEPPGYSSEIQAEMEEWNELYEP